MEPVWTAENNRGKQSHGNQLNGGGVGWGGSQQISATYELPHFFSECLREQ